MKPATENIIIVSLVLATPLGTFSEGINIIAHMTKITPKIGNLFETKMLFCKIYKSYVILLL